MIHINVLFELATIFPKSKMAAISHIGYVLTFKSHQICIEMTTQTHSYHFWSLVTACHVTAKGFMFNRSITGSHLEKVKWPKYHTQVINPVSTKVLACQNDTYVGFIWVSGHFSEIQDGRQPSCFCQTTKKCSFRIYWVLFDDYQSYRSKKAQVWFE